MAKQREPKTKLSTMRIIWGVLAGLFILQFLMSLNNGNTIIAVAQFILGVLLAWYAISPPAFVRKNFIQD